ncbi:DUF1963 domain-containing protein [Actinomadura parmotrematis]|uniref:DUF1963 domain-containing protein n=1 Tax=Actinomadura parmotrematis TaxID=2864039 RepID=A0ABS7G0D5_9ACTN|nr:DUF1963 domain-containing protein [Actinomadura parmotrematis]MBW8486016.1 DUF1963 domain-containing protein [Actinomadura parmotrematis]
MDHFESQRQRLRSLFGVFLAPEVSAALSPLIRPALRLDADGPGRGGPEAVRLGGRPRLPADASWPDWEGRPLDYLGTVDFSALQGTVTVPGLPSKGTAAFYYATGAPRPWGGDLSQQDAWRVFTGDLQETEAPAGTVAFCDASLSAVPHLSLPAPEEPAIRALEAAYCGFLNVYEQLHAAWQQHVWPDRAPMHQLGGWPAVVERPVSADCAAVAAGRDLDDKPLSADEQAALAGEAWDLLLQLDSDPRLGWFWGDPGRVYFSLRAGDPLDQAWLTVQAR